MTSSRTSASVAGAQNGTPKVEAADGKEVGGKAVVTGKCTSGETATATATATDGTGKAATVEAKGNAESKQQVQMVDDAPTNKPQTETARTVQETDPAAAALENESSGSRIPVEVIANVAEHLTTADLHSLARVRKAWQDAVEAVLYREIVCEPIKKLPLAHNDKGKYYEDEKANRRILVEGYKQLANALEVRGRAALVQEVTLHVFHKQGRNVDAQLKRVVRAASASARKVEVRFVLAHGVRYEAFPGSKSERVVDGDWPRTLVTVLTRFEFPLVEFIALPQGLSLTIPDPPRSQRMQLGAGPPKAVRPFEPVLPVDYETLMTLICRSFPKARRVVLRVSSAVVGSFINVRKHRKCALKRRHLLELDMTELDGRLMGAHTKYRYGSHLLAKNHTWILPEATLALIADATGYPPSIESIEMVNDDATRRDLSAGRRITEGPVLEPSPGVVFQHYIEPVAAAADLSRDDTTASGDQDAEDKGKASVGPPKRLLLVVNHAPVGWEAQSGYSVLSHVLVAMGEEVAAVSAHRLVKLGLVHVLGRRGAGITPSMDEWRRLVKLLKKEDEDEEE